MHCDKLKRQMSFMHGDTFEVHKFTYFSTTFTPDGALEAEINHKIASAGIAWYQSVRFRFT